MFSILKSVDHCTYDKNLKLNVNHELKYILVVDLELWTYYTNGRGGIGSSGLNRQHF